MRKIEYIDDVKIIQKVAKAHGFEMSLYEAQDFWEDYSRVHYSAGWLSLPNDEKRLWRIIANEPLFSFNDLKKLNKKKP